MSYHCRAQQVIVRGLLECERKKLLKEKPQEENESRAERFERVRNLQADKPGEGSLRAMGLRRVHDSCSKDPQCSLLGSCGRCDEIVESFTTLQGIIRSDLRQISNISRRLTESKIRSSTSRLCVSSYQFSELWHDHCPDDLSSVVIIHLSSTIFYFSAQLCSPSHQSLTNDVSFGKLTWRTFLLHSSFWPDWTGRSSTHGLMFSVPTQGVRSILHWLSLDNWYDNGFFILQAFQRLNPMNPMVQGDEKKIENI